MAFLWQSTICFDSEALEALAALALPLELGALDRGRPAVGRDLDRIAFCAGAFEAPIGIALGRPLLGDTHRERLGADAETAEVVGELCCALVERELQELVVELVVGRGGGLRRAGGWCASTATQYGGESRGGPGGG